MNDKEWLEKVSLAYKVYAKDYAPQLQVEYFITWLYEQYGIVKDDKK